VKVARRLNLPPDVVRRMETVLDASFATIRVPVSSLKARTLGRRPEPKYRELITEPVFTSKLKTVFPQ
jgi:hypothetical protein